jgi:hypothetical protein
MSPGSCADNSSSSADSLRGPRFLLQRVEIKYQWRCLRMSSGVSAAIMVHDRERLLCYSSANVRPFCFPLISVLYCPRFTDLLVQISTANSPILPINLGLRL